MIRNGLYLLSSKALDGIKGGANGVLMLRNGTIHGGDSYFYFIGTYNCFDGSRWKGELISQEHSRAPTTRPMAGRVVSVGFSGTYTDKGAEASGTALVGKRCIRYEATVCLLMAD
jgi:hypothetical protein